MKFTGVTGNIRVTNSFSNLNLNVIVEQLKLQADQENYFSKLTKRTAKYLSFHMTNDNIHFHTYFVF